MVGGHGPQAEQVPDETFETFLEQLDRCWPSLDVGIVILDESLRVRMSNEWPARLIGETAAAMTGRSVRDAAVPELQDRIEAICRDVLATGEARFDLEFAVRAPAHPDEVRSYAVSYLPLLIDSDRTAGVGCVARDVTRWRRAKDALRDSEAQLRLMIDALPAAIAYVDRELRHVYTNRLYREWTGKDAAELQGRPISEEFGSVVWQQVEPFAARALAGESVGYPVEVAGGDLVRHFEHELLPDVHAERVRGLYVLMRDVSERHEAKRALEASVAALRSSRSRLRQLAGELVGAEEEERARVARDLHDDITQRVAALGIEVDRLRTSLPPEAQAASDRLRAVHRRLVALSDQIRSVSRHLHPSSLGDVGLAQALRTECELLAERNGLRIRPELDCAEEIPDAAALCLYRIAQVALRSVGETTGDAELALTLGREAGDLVLRVHHPEAREPDASSRWLGLAYDGLREQLRLLGGRVDLDVGPERGMHLEARLRLAG